MPNAIIIGATSGIGLEIALQLAARGHRVGVAGRRQPLLDEIVGNLGAERCVAALIDITSTEKAGAKLDELAAALGEIDVIYLVAGTGFPNPDLKWEPERDTLALNCAGFAAMATAAMRLFERQGRGHLVAITSVAAARASGSAPAYGASKAFASAYLDALGCWAIQRRLHIHVTEIRPGFVDTAMMKADKPLWLIPAAVAARLTIAAADRRAKVAYIPGRWRWVAWLIRALPRRLYARIG